MLSGCKEGFLPFSETGNAKRTIWHHLMRRPGLLAAIFVLGYGGICISLSVELLLLRKLLSRRKKGKKGKSRSGGRRHSSFIHFFHFSGTKISQWGKNSLLWERGFLAVASRLPCCGVWTSLMKEFVISTRRD